MPEKLDYDEVKSLLKSRLKEKRYLHSLAVADKAKELAVQYGSDPEQAYLAGLLHDITKNATAEEHLNIFSSFGIILNDIEKGSIKLWHAISGAAYVEHILKLTDRNIIEAIRYHTTAKTNMSLLTKILYLADFTSDDRDYDDVDVLRELVSKSLDDAMMYALQYTIKDLVDQKFAIHMDTILAYNEAAQAKNKQSGRKQIGNQGNFNDSGKRAQ